LSVCKTALAYPLATNTFTQYALLVDQKYVNTTLSGVTSHHETCRSSPYNKEVSSEVVAATLISSEGRGGYAYIRAPPPHSLT